MAYVKALNSLNLSPQEKSVLKDEFDDIRAELDDIRTKFVAVLAKLDDDAGVTDTNYESTQSPATAILSAQ